MFVLCQERVIIKSVKLATKFVQQWTIRYIFFYDKQTWECHDAGKLQKVN